MRDVAFRMLSKISMRALNIREEIKLLPDASCLNCYWKFKFLLRLLNCFITSAGSLLSSRLTQVVSRERERKTVPTDEKWHSTLHFSCCDQQWKKNGSAATFIILLNGKFSRRLLSVSWARRKTAGNFPSTLHMTSSAISLKRQFLPCELYSCF